jgi:hypothetical protein
MKTGEPQGRCDTTLTERFAYPDCKCGTYPGNQGPCKDWEPSGNPLFCVYCAHGRACHEAVLQASAVEVPRGLPEEDWLRLGEAHRVIRVACGEGYQITAARLGLTTKQVVDMEHGREDPTPILAPLFAAVRAE